VVFLSLGAGRGASLAGGDDGRGLPLHFLVEDVLGLRLGQGVPVGYRLGGGVIPGGGPGCWGDPGRIGGLAEVGENPLHGGRSQ